MGCEHCGEELMNQGSPGSWFCRPECHIYALKAENERLRAALAELVRLKDGPRDDAYAEAKPKAWQAARDALEASR